MAQDACIFYYDGISSEDYGLYYYQIGNNTQDSGKINSGFSVVSDHISRRHQPIHYGVQKSDHMEFDMVFGALDFLDRMQIETIAKWLMGRSKYAPLVFENDEMFGVQYKAIFTDMDEIQYDGFTIAFKVHVVCDSPFAYTESIENVVKCGGGDTEFIFTSFSNVPELYAPDVEVALQAGVDLMMKNETTGETVSFEFDGANSSDIIMNITGKTKALNYTCEDTPSLLLNLYDHMKLDGERHFVFPRFMPGDNKVVVTCSSDNVPLTDVELNWADVFGTSEYPLGWRKGYYNYTAGAASGSPPYYDSTIRTVGGQNYIAQSNDRKLTFTAPEGYFVCIYEYDENETFIRYVGGFNRGSSQQTIETTGGYKYKFAIGKPGEDSSAILNAEFLANVTCTIKRLVLDNPVVIKYRSEFPLQIGY